MTRLHPRHLFIAVLCAISAFAQRAPVLAGMANPHDCTAGGNMGGVAPYFGAERAAVHD